VLFNSLEYLIFLSVVFLLFWGLVRLRLARVVLLFVASYLFYISWNPAYILLIAGSTLLDYLCGGLIDRTDDPRRRKLYLFFSVAGNLGLLGYFKYANFFWRSGRDLAGLLGLDVASLPASFDILLPAGISFYTFASMSYTLDIYRREIRACRDLLEYALYVAFFPQLVAGPIVRAREFLPQLETRPALSLERAGGALFLILKGMLKKVVIADYLAVNLVDRVYDNPSWYSSGEVAVAIFAYSLQIYYDFSAYTDIARGSALLFGFELPENFRRPYQSQNVAEFWQRWHMTLSRWIRDYLYISLGGSRGTRLATYRNLIVTWLLMGLWHGASWTFVAWGGFYALALSLNHLRRERAGGKRPGRVDGWRGAWRTALTLTIVTGAWIPFRSPTFGGMLDVLGRLVAGDPGFGQITPSLWVVFALGWAIQLSPARWVEGAQRQFVRLPAPVKGAVAAGIGAALLQLAEAMPVPFIYFQF
jgi:D-alanyl-lipoteichoic acid acyltransferase DltB (MBOAT superfamily)